MNWTIPALLSLVGTVWFLVFLRMLPTAFADHDPSPIHVTSLALMIIPIFVYFDVLTERHHHNLFNCTEYNMVVVGETRRAFQDWTRFRYFIEPGGRLSFDGSVIDEVRFYDGDGNPVEGVGLDEVSNCVFCHSRDHQCIDRIVKNCKFR